MTQFYPHQQRFVDKRGSLLLIDPLPFDVKRVFWISGVPVGEQRGGHAHASCRQLIQCIAGRFCLTCRTKDWKTHKHFLHSGLMPVLVEPLTWVDLEHFTADAVCLVLASEPWTEPISNIDEFYRLISK